eukprot:GHVS01012020.1.p1 GENE.GHVS01012020.1~~GHVS01012020.1.p1  ORF type:complete len:241 (+),score=58.34 GHVS01012020.1:171-893(+)
MEETKPVKEEDKKCIVKQESSSDDNAPLLSSTRKNRKVLSDEDSDDAPLRSSTKRKAKAAPGSRAAAGTVKKETAKKKALTTTSVNRTAKTKGAGGAAKTKTAAAGRAAVKEKPASRARSKVKKEEGAEAGEDDNIPGDARKYFKEGQKHITPPNGDGTRAFYESLYDDNPNSLVALKFCVEYGVLTGTKHHAALAQFEALKFMGAYKGPPGGIRKEFADGPPKKILAKFERPHSHTTHS